MLLHLEKFLEDPIVQKDFKQMKQHLENPDELGFEVSLRKFIDNISKKSKNLHNDLSNVSFATSKQVGHFYKQIIGIKRQQFDTFLQVL